MINLTNKRFGKIVVVERSQTAKGKWKYICDCGNTGEAYTSDIANGKVKSCGCARFRKKDISAKRYGRLTAIRPTGITTKMGAEWLCKCDCGNTIATSIGSLTSGHTQSCGCLNYSAELVNRRKETSKKYNVEGTRAAMLRPHKQNKNNSSGITGVFWNKKANKWTAQIMFKRKQYWLGDFLELKYAAQVRKEAEEKIFGEFLEWYENEYNKKLINRSRPN